MIPFEVLGLLLTVISFFSLTRWGFVGRLAANMYRLVAGEAYMVLSILGIVFGIAFLFKGKSPTLSKNKVFAVSLLFISLLVFLHARLFGPVINPQLNVIVATWRFFLADFLGNTLTQSLGGGMIGALMYGVSYFLFSHIGTFLITLLLFSSGIILLFELPYKQTSKHFFDFSKKTGKIFAEKMRAALSFSERKSRKKVKVVQDDKNKQQSNNEGISDKKQFVEKESVKQATIEPSQLKINSYQESSEVKNNEAEDSNVDFEINGEVENEDYALPPVTLLDRIEPTDQSQEYSLIQKNVEKLEETFQSFGVDATVTKANLGPAVTKYEIQPATGVKVSKIVGLTDDIALALAAKDIRMEAPIPGKAMIGIEVPNSEVSLVSFKDVIESQTKNKEKMLEVPLGRDISGQISMADLSKMPHLLVAGATGSGKSVCINGVITSLLMKAKPNEVKLMMIDPKMVELNVYNGIPHLLTPVVTNPKKAAQALQKVVQEMERRYELFAASGTRNMEGYNKFIKHKNEEAEEILPELPFIVVIVDELADLMMVASNEVEDAIIRLAQMARAAGIHMILATQRPSVDVITGIIKANVPSRIAFAVSSGTDSRTILDANGAEKLLGKGDMLFQPMGQNKPTRVQGAFISDNEVEAVVNFVKNQQEANYVEEMIPKEEPKTAQGEAEDELFDDAVELIVDMQTASISLLQRRFRIGYNRAARMIDEMEMRGIVGPSEGSKPRVVNISKPDGEND
nr:DNA translocase FtsK [Lacticigenium naphthae]